MRALWLCAVLAVSGCDTANLDGFGGDLTDGGPQAGLTTGAARPAQTGGSWFSGLWSGAPAQETSIDAAPLTFGVVAKLCDYRTRDLGTQVDAKGGFTLYDSNPKLLAPRSHYITGFRDGCARVFTAGLVIMGDPAVHEARRYSSTHAFSDVDGAYEILKNRLCRVGDGEPCGDRMDRLIRYTTFVSLYPVFGSSKSAGELLLHQGRLRASQF